MLLHLRSLVEDVAARLVRSFGVGVGVGVGGKAQRALVF